MLFDTIYSEVEDEVTDIVDRFRSAEQDAVVLVLPRGSLLAQSLVNLKLLGREAEKLGLTLTLVTPDPIIQHLAKEAGLSARSEIDEKKTARSVPGVDDISDRVPGDFSRRQIEVQSTDASTENKKEGADIPITRDVTGKKSTLPSSVSEDPVVSDVVATDPVSLPKKPESSPVATGALKTSVPPAPAFSSDVSRPVQPSSQDAIPAVDTVRQFNEKNKTKEKVSKRQPKVRPQKIGGTPRAKLLPRLTRIVLAIVIVLALAAGGAALVWFLPKATITVQPKTESFIADMTVTLTKDVSAVDESVGVIPGEPISVEELSPKQSFEATSVSTVDGTKAKGEIVVTNAYSSNPQPLVASTRFLTDDNKLFRLVEGVVIPGMDVGEEGELSSTTLTVSVEADEPGVDYNIQQTGFTIPGLGSDARSKITGQSNSPFTGGTDPGGGDTVVSQEDMDKAVESVRVGAAEAAAASLQESVAIGEIILPEALRTDVSEVRSTGDVGDVRDTFDVELLVKAHTLAFQENDLRDVIYGQLEGQLPDGREFPDTSFTGVDFSLSSYDTASETIELDVSIDKDVVVALPESEIRPQLTGKTADEVQNFLLDQYGVVSARVAFWPFWVEHVPRLDSKVEIVLDTSSDEQ